MTRSKRDLAEWLAKLKDDGSKADDYVHMRVMLLHHEIQKLEDARPPPAPVPVPVPPPPTPKPKAKPRHVRGLWSRLHGSDSESD
jgi:hypothetical protein